VVGFAFCGVLVMLLYRMTRWREIDARTLLRHMEEVRDLYHNAPCGYHSVNEEGVFLSINDTELRWLGYQREELIGKKRHADLLTPESQQRYAKVFAQFKLEGEVRDVRFDMVRKDGTILPVLVNSSMIRDPAGRFVGTRTTLYDYTERKRLENIQREFQALFESLPGACLVLRPDFTIWAVTDEFLKATMTSREQILGRNLFEAFPDNPENSSATGASNLRASLERVLQQGAPDTMAIQRYDVRRPDGSFELRYWSPINSPVFDAEHSIQYIIHRVEDVTAFVTREQKSGEDLHGQVERMEAEIYASAQAVEVANQKLRQANEELESFSYSVSHDLRAPLRHINGFSQMLEQHLGGNLDDKARHYLRTIGTSARQMGTLIDGLLAFSRIGRSEMKIQRVSLGNVVHSVVQSLAQEIGERKVLWEIAPLPDVEGDPVLLYQVFANLLGNAVKYTAKVDPALIEIGTEPADVGSVQVFVKDNGAGFDPKYAGKLFGVFQRLHSPREFEGNGVGLATVRRIVQRHGGRVSAEGAPGAGAKFTVSFKLPGCQPTLPTK
jgi:PAS domain S-box-containing protein